MKGALKCSIEIAWKESALKSSGNLDLHHNLNFLQKSASAVRHSVRALYPLVPPPHVFAEGPFVEKAHTK